MMLEIEPACDEVPPPPSPPRASNGATKQNLSFAAIMIIACNTMNGPGLTTLPNVAHSGGQLAFVVLVYLAVATTVFCVKRLCLLMWQQNPEHHHAGPVLEETDLVALSAAAWQPKQVDPQYATLPVQEEPLNEGHDVVQSIEIEPTILQAPPLQQSKARRMASLAMVGCALALALAQMMLCAKIADSMIVASFGKNCGLGWDALFHCTSNLSMQPFAAAPVGTDSEVDPTTGVGNPDTCFPVWPYNGACSTTGQNSDFLRAETTRQAASSATRVDTVAIGAGFVGAQPEEGEEQPPAPLGGMGLEHDLVLFADSEDDHTLTTLLPLALRIRARSPGVLSIRVVARGTRAARSGS